jgi:hypothetical protein
MICGATHRSKDWRVDFFKICVLKHVTDLAGLAMDSVFGVGLRV